MPPQPATLEATLALFERLVIDLLVEMGYDGSPPGRWQGGKPQQRWRHRRDHQGGRTRSRRDSRQGICKFLENRRMSENNGDRVWVGDLDGYVYYDDFDSDDEHENQEELLETEIDEIGELQLLAGKTISARQLYQKNISPSEWRHALHQAEMTIGFGPIKEHQETGANTDSSVIRFVKGMLDLGRPYAIARYARWERLDYPSALTATLPHGIRALVNQLLAAEGITRTREAEESIRAVLKPCEKGEMTAYRRTGMLQTALHQIANDTPNHPGGTKLDRKRMRYMLALARLYFSTAELRLTSIEELRSLFRNYELERVIAQRTQVRLTTNGRLIRSWRLRHVQPLLNLYPYSIRHSLKRAVEHEPDCFDRTALVNELALAHCGIFRMRAAGKART
jgi:hypothetical protein